MELRDGSEGRTEIGRSEGHGASGFPFSEPRGREAEIAGEGRTNGGARVRRRGLSQEGRRG